MAIALLKDRVIYIGDSTSSGTLPIARRTTLHEVRALQTMLTRLLLLG